MRITTGGAHEPAFATLVLPDNKGGFDTFLPLMSRFEGEPSHLHMIWSTSCDVSRGRTPRQGDVDDRAGEQKENHFEDAALHGQDGLKVQKSKSPKVRIFKLEAEVNARQRRALS